MDNLEKAAEPQDSNNLNTEVSDHQDSPESDKEVQRQKTRAGIVKSWKDKIEATKTREEYDALVEQAPNWVMEQLSPQAPGISLEEITNKVKQSMLEEQRYEQIKAQKANLNLSEDVMQIVEETELKLLEKGLSNAEALELALAKAGVTFEEERKKAYEKGKKMANMAIPTAGKSPESREEVTFENFTDPKFTDDQRLQFLEKQRKANPLS